MKRDLTAKEVEELFDEHLEHWSNTQGRELLKLHNAAIDAIGEYSRMMSKDGFLNGVIATLDALNNDDEIPEDASEPVEHSTGTDAEKVDNIDDFLLDARVDLSKAEAIWGCLSDMLHISFSTLTDLQVMEIRSNHDQISDLFYCLYDYMENAHNQIDKVQRTDAPENVRAENGAAPDSGIDIQKCVTDVDLIGCISGLEGAASCLRTLSCVTDAEDGVIDFPSREEMTNTLFAVAQLIDRVAADLSALQS